MPPRILCVDDDRNFCEILARAFKGEGYEVRKAHDGAEALRALEQFAPDLVTLDVLLPKRDGFEVLEAMRGCAGVASQVPVILLSGCSASPGYRRRAEELGASYLTKPVPLERLLALAAKQIGSASAGPPPAAPGRGARRAAELSGSLEKVPFAALLHHLHGLRATGVLHLECGRKKKKLQMRDGHPVAVQSNLVDECLGNLLAATGTISWDVMHESLRRVKRGDGPQGQILVAMHMLDEKDLAAALRNQAEEKLLEIFTWEGGRFHFQRGVRLKRPTAFTLKRSPARIIVEGVRTRLPLARLDAFFAERRCDRVVPVETPFYRFQDVDVDVDGHGLLAEIDGSTTLAEVLPADEGSRRALYAWIAAGLLELRPPRPTAIGAEPPRAQRERAPRPAPSAGGEPRGESAFSPLLASPPQEEGIRTELAAMAARFRGRDYFGILGVPRRTDDVEVRNAYFALAKQTHPDRFSNSSDAVKRLAEEVFGLISKAYETLSDAERRLQYVRAERNRERDEAELDEGQRALRAELEFNKGEACLARKHFDRAVEHFQEAVRIYPEEGEYHAHLGWALHLTDPHSDICRQEALDLVLHGRKLAPDREKSYLFLGRLYKAADRHALAEKMFARAVQLDPDCVDAVRELRLIDMRRQKSRGIVKRILRR